MFDSKKKSGISRRTFMKGAAAGAAGLAAASTVLGSTAMAATAGEIAVSKSACVVTVNGKDVDFEAYLINSNNYLKLRDLAYILNGTAKQFAVSFDSASKTVNMTAKQSYAVVGGEMSALPTTASAKPTSWAVYLDGKIVDAAAYLINGNNYFKLRDICEALDIYVGYEAATNAVSIDTGYGYGAVSSALAGSLSGVNGGKSNPASSTVKKPGFGNDDVEELEIKAFPCATTAEYTAAFTAVAKAVGEGDGKFHPEIYYHPYTGLFQQVVYKQEDGVERQMLTYIADKTRNCCSTIYLAVPTVADPVKFFLQSGWKQVADENGILVHILIPAVKQWGQEATELAYMAACYSNGSRTAKYSPYTGNYYFIGYGDGGQLLQEYIMSNPEACAGMLIFDGSEISNAYLDKMAATDYASDPSRKLNQVKAPVWLVSEKDSKQARAVAQYWLKANRCSDTYYTKDCSINTIVYPEKVLSIRPNEDDYCISSVTLSKAKVDYADKDFVLEAWETLRQVERYRSLCNNDLRPARDFAALGVNRYETVINGYSRYWLEYVPSYYDGSAKLPVVVALHGAGQTGDAYFGYSEWFKVAEDNGFIAVFPTAYPFSENNGMARPIHNDASSSLTVDFVNGLKIRPDDIDFLAKLLDNLKSRYQIDGSRIYTTGHSNGGNYCQRIAADLSDMVTACAISAGRFRTSAGLATAEAPKTIEALMSSLTRMNAGKSTNKTPILLEVGTKDGGAYRNAGTYYSMYYWLARNECVGDFSAAPYKTQARYQCGAYSHQVWYDEAGVPMYHYMIVDGKIHTTMPSESEYMYESFLSLYSRNADGSISYQGGAIKHEE